MQAQDRVRETTQVVPIAVVNTGAWLGRGLYYDVLALSVNLLAGAALALDVYSAGYLRATASAAPDPSFGALARIAVEIVALGASFAWVAARLLRASYRDLPRTG